MVERARKHVLAVEDENPIQKLLVDIFEDAGYSIQTARLGEEAVRKAKIYNPDVVSKPFDIVDLLDTVDDGLTLNRWPLS